jgi:hypothetical protein
MDLESAPEFYPASGNEAWHYRKATAQPTWEQLIRVLLIAQGRSDSPDAILEYQRSKLGAAVGETCLLELFPLPSPNTRSWRYCDWSKLEWLSSRERYQEEMILPRACFLARQIERHRPATVIFYGSTSHRIWSAIAGGTWRQAEHSIMTLCQYLEVSPSSYYDWQRRAQRPASASWQIKR